MIRNEIDPETGISVIKYQYIRRNDSLPKVNYVTEISVDGITFVPAEPDQVVTLTPFWEEVTVIIGGTDSGLKACFARVSVEVEDDNNDGF